MPGNYVAASKAQLGDARTLPLDAWLCVTRASSFSCRELALLSQVCKLWREVISDSMDLWLHINFGPYEHNVTDEVALRLLTPSRMSAIRSLNLSNCNGLTASTIEQLVARCNCSLQINAIDLSFCTAVNDSVLKRIAECCPDMTCLCLNGLERITDHGVKYAVKKCPNLKMLEASNASLSDRLLDCIENGKFKIMMLDSYS